MKILFEIEQQNEQNSKDLRTIRTVGVEIEKKILVVLPTVFTKLQTLHKKLHTEMMCHNLVKSIRCLIG